MRVPTIGSKHICTALVAAIAYTMVDRRFASVVYRTEPSQKKTKSTVTGTVHTSAKGFICVAIRLRNWIAIKN